MNNSLLDFNFYNGDLIIKNFNCHTNSSTDILENLEDQLKTMIYSLIIYDDTFKTEVLGLRITDKNKFEDYLKNKILNIIKNAYPLNQYIQTLELIVIIINDEAFCFFYYLSPEDNKIKLLLDYNIKI